MVAKMQYGLTRGENLETQVRICLLKDRRVGRMRGRRDGAEEILLRRPSCLFLICRLLICRFWFELKQCADKEEA